MDHWRIQVFADMIAGIKCGNVRNSTLKSKAKPIFLVSLIDYILYIKENKIVFPNNLLQELYRTNVQYYDPSCKAPLVMPFFHLNTEPFYELIWKTQGSHLSYAHTPSVAYMREHVAYAKLDDMLWELLQDEDNRQSLRQAIITKYLS